MLGNLAIVTCPGLSKFSVSQAIGTPGSLGRGQQCYRCLLNRVAELSIAVVIDPGVYPGRSLDHGVDST